VLRLLAVPLALVALQQYESSVRPLPEALERNLARGESWRPGCPVPLSDLRLLTVRHWDFEGRERTGQLVVHRDAAPELARVFRRLYQLEFPIRHMKLDDMYGPKRARPADGDVTGSFRCRRAVPSPCGSGSGNWSNHAYGLAVDINPIENPYVYPGGTTVHAASRPFLDRSKHRRGMAFRGGVLVRAFAQVGWKWGGNWRPPSATDYQHFSSTGR
jgi:hypothetical protein